MSQRHLVPCPSCNRHVFSDSCVCTFCEAALTGHSCASLAAPPPRGDRVGRVATMAAAASLLGASACSGSTHYGVNIPWDAAVDSDPADHAVDGSTDQAADGSTDGSDDAASAASAPTNVAGGGSPRSGGR